jgi:hypothetical protein
MNRRVLPLVSLTVLSIFLAASGSSAAGAKPVLGTAPKAVIASVTLLPSGCGTEVTCVEVKWNVQNPPANLQTMSFEVTGKLTTDSGSCTSTAQNISDNTVRSAKVGFFQGGTCAGQAKSADMTVKLFTRDIEGQKVLASTGTKSQIF